MRRHSTSIHDIQSHQRFKAYISGKKICKNICLQEYIIISQLWLQINGTYLHLPPSTFFRCVGVSFLQLFLISVSDSVLLPKNDELGISSKQRYRGFSGSTENGCDVNTHYFFKNQTCDKIPLHLSCP